jgi:hypothetical protein
MLSDYEMKLVDISRKYAKLLAIIQPEIVIHEADTRQVPITVYEHRQISTQMQIDIQVAPADNDNDSDHKQQQQQRRKKTPTNSNSNSNSNSNTKVTETETGPETETGTDTEEEWLKQKVVVFNDKGIDMDIENLEPNTKYNIRISPLSNLNINMNMDVDVNAQCASVVVPFRTKSLIQSEILTAIEKKWLDVMLSKHLHTNSNANKYDLLYRASRDKYGAAAFHKICKEYRRRSSSGSGSDTNICGYVTVVHSQFNHVFGGFTTQLWTADGDYHADGQAFLFLLRSQFKTKTDNLLAPQKYPIREKKIGRAVKHHKSCICSFGEDSVSDICITPNNNYYTYCQSTNCYIGNTGNILCGGRQFKDDDSYFYFEVQDLEVYALKM